MITNLETEIFKFILNLKFNNIETIKIFNNMLDSSINLGGGLGFSSIFIILLIISIGFFALFLAVDILIFLYLMIKNEFDGDFRGLTFHFFPFYIVLIICYLISIIIDYGLFFNRIQDLKLIDKGLYTETKIIKKLDNCKFYNILINSNYKRKSSSGRYSSSGVEYFYPSYFCNNSLIEVEKIGKNLIMSPSVFYNNNKDNYLEELKKEYGETFSIFYDSSGKQILFIK